MTKCVFCNICVEELEEVNERNAVFWMNLCAKFVEQDFRALAFKHEYSLVKELEEKNALHTHEDKRAIWIIPEGYLDADEELEEHYFCLNPKGHYPDEDM